MEQVGWRSVWDGVVEIPVSGRFRKPRNRGLTMVMDKGMGLYETSELLSMAGGYIDYIKLAFGTPALYNGEILQKKIDLIRSNKIHVYPGGTFFEIAVLQNRMEAFLEKLAELGFTAVEVSDGTVPISPDMRHRAIEMAAGAGFQVLSEVGKKDPSDNLTVDQIVLQLESDIESGVHKVIMEARESGLGIGIFNDRGEIKKEQFAELLAKIPDVGVIIWEAPLKKQQQELILTFGPNVNLGNVPPAEVLALESLRVGLRGDTLKPMIRPGLTDTKL